jgi:hypothetical protein
MKEQENGDSKPQANDADGNDDFDIPETQERDFLVPSSQGSPENNQLIEELFQSEYATRDPSASQVEVEHMAVLSVPPGMTLLHRLTQARGVGEEDDPDKAPPFAPVQTTYQSKPLPDATPNTGTSGAITPAVESAMPSGSAQFLSPYSFIAEQKKRPLPSGFDKELSPLSSVSDSSSSSDEDEHEPQIRDPGPSSGRKRKRSSGKAAEVSVKQEKESRPVKREKTNNKSETSTSKNWAEIELQHFGKQGKPFKGFKWPKKLKFQPVMVGCDKCVTPSLNNALTKL